jgi:hypothetical protein
LPPPLALASFPQPARAGGDDKVSPWVTAATANGGSTGVLVVMAERAELDAAAAYAIFADGFDAGNPWAWSTIGP